LNAADAKAAQMFTLAHELAHVWLGQSGVSKPTLVGDRGTESCCNSVAAEILIPLRDFRAAWRGDEVVLAEVKRLAQQFKVSTLVILIRASRAHMVDQPTFERLYEEERQSAFRAGGGGGDYYRTQEGRLSGRFMEAVISSALEGETLYSEAFSLL